MFSLRLSGSASNVPGGNNADRCDAELPGHDEGSRDKLLRALDKLFQCFHCKIYLEIHLLLTHYWIDGFKHKMYYIT